MSRRQFKIASSVSLLLFVAVGLLWPLSYLEWSVRSWRSRFVIIASHGDDRSLVESYAIGPGGFAAMLEELRIQATTHWVHVGIEFHIGTIRIDELGGGPKTKYYIVLIPHWFMLFLCSILPVCWATRATFSRACKGHCRRCGYDLRASAGRCPECGTAQTTA